MAIGELCNCQITQKRQVIAAARVAVVFAAIRCICLAFFCDFFGMVMCLKGDEG